MTSVSAVHTLSQWINLRYLDVNVLSAKKEEFHASPERLTIMDDFLLPKVVEHLQHFFKFEAVYQHAHRLSSKAERVDRESWFAAPESDRFYKHNEIVGIAENSRMSKHAVTYLKFRHIISQPAFLSIFNSIAACKLCIGHNSINAKCYRYGDFLRPHTDAIHKRVLCGNLYLSPLWHSNYGGQFGIYNGETDQTHEIQPLCNRLVIFDPQKEFKHWITPITDKAEGMSRYSISFWYDAV